MIEERELHQDRCSGCKRELQWWGGRLLCANAHCSGHVPSSRGAVSVDRAERVAQISRLRGDGLTFAAIADEMGLTATYVRELLSDPTGLRRREKYLRSLRKRATDGQTLGVEPRENSRSGR